VDEITKFEQNPRAGKAGMLLGYSTLMTADQFGPGLRAAREQRGISLEALAATTKVSIELWEAMERNDFSRWPSGVFARAFVRDYAVAVGLDADAVVNDFCRFFSIGDRRAIRIVRAQAQLLGQDPQANPAELLPAGRERRKARGPKEPPAPAPNVYTPRILAAGIDLLCVGTLAASAAGLFGVGMLPAAGVLGSTYFTASTIASGSSPGSRIIEALRHRAPAIFTSRRPISA
jgi:transcriptional regulator with XRE-family HTH domain